MDALQTLLTALGGAIIGAASSVATIFIQARYQTKRDRLKTIADVALAEQRAALEFAKGHPGAMVPPLALFLAYQAETLRIVEERELTPQDLRQLNAKHDALWEIVKPSSKLAKAGDTTSKR